MIHDGVTEKDIAEWRSLAEALKSVKGDEMTLRKRIVAFFFNGKKKGTHRLIVGDAELKAELSTRLDVSESDLIANASVLTEEEKACIKWKPTVIASKYNKLKPEQKARLSRIVSEKPSAPSLTVTDI